MSLNNDLIGLYGSIDSSDELTAVNDILEVIGQSPVNSLRNQSDLDVSTARRMLASENKRRKTQSYHLMFTQGLLLIVTAICVC